VPNPWLNVPLSDYEGHMLQPEVGQLGVLADLFEEALVRCRPESVAILGVAGGNGLERIDSAITKRVVGIDINPAYLDAVRQRFPRIPGLELHCLDLSAETAAIQPLQLVHAALVFEHVGAERCLENALALVTPGGALSVVLQLPGEPGTEVATTPFTSIQELKADFQLIDPARFQRTLVRHGFGLVHQTVRPLPAGKAFWMGILRSTSFPEGC
jgi:SAM-dependent methyltransferase